MQEKWKKNMTTYDERLLQDIRYPQQLAMDYRKTSSINRTESQLKCILYPLAVVFDQSIEAMC